MQQATAAVQRRLLHFMHGYQNKSQHGSCNCGMAPAWPYQAPSVTTASVVVTHGRAKEMNSSAADMTGHGVSRPPWAMREQPNWLVVA